MEGKEFVTIDEIFEIILDWNKMMRKEYKLDITPSPKELKETIRNLHGYSYSRTRITEKLSRMIQLGYIYRTSRGSNEYKIIKKYKIGRANV